MISHRGIIIITKVQLTKIFNPSIKILCVHTKVSSKKSQDFNEEVLVDIVDTQHNKNEAIKNAPKITHWDMETVNILYSSVEKYNLAECTEQEFVDLFENYFTRQQIYNLKVMINAMEK